MLFRSEGLVVVALQLRAAGLHLEEHALGPEQVGELLSALRTRTVALDEFELRRAGLFRDAKLERSASLDGSRMSKRAEEAFEKCLRLALFVATQGTCEGREFVEGGTQFSRGHGRRVSRMAWCGKRGKRAAPAK